MDWTLAAAAFGIGIVVGLTGMGGGALMTPVLVLFFNVPPLTAVSSDLVASAVMKPVGSLVHLRHGTVNLQLVKWLVIGSVPSAFLGVVLLQAFADDEQIQHAIKIALGCALLMTAVGLVVRAYMRLAERARERDGRADPLPTGVPRVTVRPIPTVLLGIAGGLIVGLTSVGSGSLVIIGLMMLYPGLKASQLVGTDLVQAVPLVASAALAHALFGDLDMSVTWPLLIGSIPGVFIGAQMSARMTGGFVRRALAFVLLASALKMLGVSNEATVAVLLATLLLAPPMWMLVRRRHGFPAMATKEKRATVPATPAPPDDSGPPGPATGPTTDRDERV
ncbi:sulfite exporter TauE/SafE family protein [Cellulomonas sp. DKR-3]|uniref:Probable membrane transporter protein n=1 Tax=Cellulomonas fulva TaxID=2835530 RepID=A0ABS5TUV4_9CELL|nr:sulfite exporter TauE/SafE family protein [Cellulomonas fulva]MBT0992892.1 sulfite exporter TauE/SafE family protein [Cellulomonas fulva]